MDSYESKRLDKLIELIIINEQVSKKQAEAAELMTATARELRGYIKGKTMQENSRYLDLPDIEPNRLNEPERNKTNLDNLITKLNADFKAAKPKKEIEQMPPQYKDGTLRQRKNGLYEYRFKESPKPVYGRTPQICYDKRTAILRGETAKNTSIKPKVMTTGEWLIDWYNRFRKGNQGDKTQENAAYNIKHIINGIGNIPLSRISTEQLQDFLNGFNNRRNVQDKLKKMLKSCFEKAMSRKHIKTNPFNGVEISSHKYKSYPAIQPVDQNRIIEAINTLKYLRLFKFCCTGLRISEALGVKASDFDTIAGIIDVKGVDTATKRHKRQIPYLPDLIDLPENGLLFLNTTYSGAKTYFRKLFEKTGINAVIHSFRHTFSSCCNHVGINGKLIQSWLGHSNIQMTMDTYTHIIRNQTSPILEYLKRLKSFVENH